MLNYCKYLNLTKPYRFNWRRGAGTINSESTAFARVSRCGVHRPYPGGNLEHAKSAHQPGSLLQIYYPCPVTLGIHAFPGTRHSQGPTLPFTFWPGLRPFQHIPDNPVSPLQHRSRASNSNPARKKLNTHKTAYSPNADYFFYIQ